MKVIILQQYLPHYRIPFFHELGKRPGIELTVFHGDNIVTSDFPLSFKQVVAPIKEKKYFIHVFANLKEICSGFDVVISLYNLRILSFWKLAFLPNRSFKFIFWGIGVSSKKGYDKESRFNFVRFRIAKNADAIIFYSKYPVNKYASAGVPPEKIFVSNNTVLLNAEFLWGNEEQKDSFLFLGTLYPDKKIEELIEAFAIAKASFNREIFLHIIGDGEMRPKVELLIRELKLEKYILLYGAINDPAKQKEFFSRSIACISPGQAGLSVLQSMAFGIPFVTHQFAITGGEKFNIVNEQNGLLYSPGSQNLADILIKLVNQPQWAKNLGNNAFLHFNQHCTIDIMVGGHLKAIEFVMNSKNV